MNFDLTDEQESLRDTLLELFEKASGTPDVRAAAPLGFDESLWRTVADMGIHAIAVDVDHGGGGGGFLELSLAAECAGGALAPIPLVESAVATTLLASLSETEAPDSPSTRATSGASIATLALHPVDDGVARVVPAGAVADYVAALRGSPAPELVVVETGGKRPALANLGSMPVADVDVGGSDATVL